jgi:hypothetical protein
MRAVRALVTGLVLAALPTVIAAPANAGTACGIRSLANPFTSWGDTNDYFLAPSGTFESGTSGWTVSSGVSTVSENEPWKVAGSTHSKSLRIPGGGSAVTPDMCVASDENAVRFFVKTPGVAGQSLRIQVRVTNPSTHSIYMLSFGITSTGYSAWVLSPAVPLPDLTGLQGKQNLQITFAPSSTAAAWLIDDVYVDPYRTK